MDAAGHARITDFGLARVTKNLDSIRSASGDQGHTARWTAPEVLKEEGEHSKEADVFAFAMVMIEVRRGRVIWVEFMTYCHLEPPQAFTGAIPFDNIPPAPAMFAIMSGGRPPRPTHPALTEQLWILMQCCWHQDPHLRPETSKVLTVLNGS